MAQLVASSLRAPSAYHRHSGRPLKLFPWLPLVGPGTLTSLYPLVSGSPGPAQDGGQALPLPHHPAVLLSV